MKLFAIYFALLLISYLPSGATGFSLLPKDTVELNFGKSKLVFYINDKEDIELLKTYDLNQLTEQMPDLLDSANDSPGSLEMIQKVEKKEENYDWEGFNNWKFCDNRKSRHVHNIHLDIGLNNWLEGGKTPDTQGKPYGLKPIESRYIGIGSIHKIRLGKNKGPFNFQFGGEISWNNYMFENQITLRQDDLGKPSFESVLDVTGGYASSKSKLTVANVGIPLTIGFEAGKGGRFTLNAGGYVNYRLASYTRIVYHVEGNKNDLRDYKNYGINNIRYGLTGNIGYEGFSAFFRYDLVPLFSEASGLPELNTVMAGIKIVM